MAMSRPWLPFESWGPVSPWGRAPPTHSTSLDESPFTKSTWICSHIACATISMAEKWTRGASVSEPGVREAAVREGPARNDKAKGDFGMDGAPSYDVDIYSDEVISEPYRHYRAIRD